MKKRYWSRDLWSTRYKCQTLPVFVLSLKSPASLISCNLHLHRELAFNIYAEFTMQKSTFHFDKPGFMQNRHCVGCSELDSPKTTKIMQIFMQVLNTCCRPCFNPGSLDALNHRCVPGAGSGDGVLIDWCIITKSSKKIFLGKPLGSPLQSFKFVRERLPRRLAIAWRRPHSSFQGRLVKTKGRREWRCCVLKKSSNNDQH